MRTALIPFEVQPGQPKQNMSHLQEVVARAVVQRPGIICLPEMVDVGEQASSLGQNFPLAQPIPGPNSDQCVMLARQYGVMLIVGLLERDDDDFFSTAVIVSPDGNILLKNRQVHNGPPYASGHGFQTIDTHFGRISLAICGDVFEADFIQQQIALNSQHIFVPMDFCGDDNECGQISTHSPPAFLAAWQDRFAEISREMDATLYAVNALSADTAVACGACGGAFVYRSGRLLFESELCIETICVV